MGAGFCSLYRKIHYIEVRYIKVLVYYIILDSPRGSVLKYRRLVVLELGIHVFFSFFFSGKILFAENLIPGKWIHKKYIGGLFCLILCHPEKWVAVLILASFWQPIQLLSVSDVALYVPNHYVFGQHHGGFYTYSGRRIDT